MLQNIGNSLMKRTAYRLPFALSVVFASMLSGAAYAEDEDVDVMGDMSLQDLFAIDTDIASNTSRSVTEQPSIISVITRDQIQNSGARDLIDVLRMVPGFGFVHDTVGINTWGFRGLYGHEGKIMLMVDGSPMNDAAWGNMQFGKHYPVDLIEKIEIIRGPGAAKFGNYAELAMVRVTTVGKEMNGGFVDSNIRAFTEDALGSNEITAAYGQELESGWGYSTALHVKNANRTVLPFENADGSVSTLQDYSPTHTVWFDTKISYKDFEFSTLIEKYDFVHEESFLQVPTPAMEMTQGYDRFDWGLDYSTEINESWSMNASYLFQETMSHDMVVTESRDNDLAIGSHYRINTERDIIALDFNYTINENSSVSFGVEKFEVTAESLAIGEFFVDPGHGLEGDSTEFTDAWFQGAKSFDLEQESAFVQYENYNDIVNFTVGVRFADHSRSAEKVTVPRIGLSKSWGDFGAKLMYSEAFRTGDAEHVNLFSGVYQGQPADQLKPETLDSTELEIHYLHETGMYTLNYFQMNIQDSIVFNTNALTENLGIMETSGFEGSWVQKKEDYEQEITFSYYQADDGSVPVQLAKSGDAFLGMPTLKVTWRLDYKLSEETTIAPSFMYEGKKWWRADAADFSKDVELDAVFKLNVAITHKFNENFEVLFAVHDLLDDGYYFPQAYGQINYPGDSRELSLSMQYNF
jgi:outer membrane receptor for ferrienterochelin and colicin